MGYFAGGQRGVNLPVGAVSMNAYSYKGLVSNELRAGRTWGCPQQSYLPFTDTQVLSVTACYTAVQSSQLGHNVGSVMRSYVVISVLEPLVVGAVFCLQRC